MKGNILMSNNAPDYEDNLYFDPIRERSKIFDLIEKEKQRQENEICLIASENYASKDILEAQGSILNQKYAEGYPNKRYYGGCKYIDEIEQYAIDKVKELFNCKYANVQPHSGSQANQAVYLALCQPGDTILGMDLNAGGHLTHGSKVSSSGKLYNAVSYGLDDNGIINYEEIEEKLYTYQPNLLVVGASAYPRQIDFERIRKLLDKYNNLMQNAKDEGGDSLCIPYCYLMVDCAHIAGLVATGLHPSPLPYANVVTSTTHKTLRGPRGGIILTNNEEIAKKIDKAVFPGIQGGPLEHVIAGKAICFEEALKPEFKEYQSQVLKNIKAMERIFKENNVNMVSDGSDNHLILLDLKDEKFSGKDLENVLEKQGIVVNKNAVKDDPRPKTETSGIRLGTAAITTRGAKTSDAVEIAKIICYNIADLRYFNAIPDEHFEYNKKWIKNWCKEHPIYK